jgi:hypothetical protein
MWTERQMFVIIQKFYDKVTSKNNRQMSSIKIDALIN